MRAKSARLNRAARPVAAGVLLLGLASASSEAAQQVEIKLTASDGEAYDSFYRVAISGSTAVIGASGDDDLVSKSGSAYIFERDPVDPADWIQTAKLVASDGAEEDLFGQEVAISGDTVVIGAPHDAGDFGRDSGSGPRPPS